MRVLWIRLRVNLREEPEVIAMAARLGVHETFVVGALAVVWSWANDHTRDGRAAFVTGAWLDRHAGLPGLAEAMAAVGWLQITPEGLTFPAWDAHNGLGARERHQAAERQRRHRDRERQGPPNKDERDLSRPRHGDVTEESRRERDQKEKENKRENTPPLPPLGGGEGAVPPFSCPELQSVWDEWDRYHLEARHRMPPQSRRAQAERMAAMGPERAREAVRFSVAGGYRTLAEPPRPAGPGRPRPETREERIERLNRDIEADRAGRRPCAAGASG